MPETKTLKKLVRDIIDPSRDLGHVDRLKAHENAAPTACNLATKASDKMPVSQPESSAAGQEGSSMYSDDNPGPGTEEGKKEPNQDGTHKESTWSGDACEECS